MGFPNCRISFLEFCTTDKDYSIQWYGAGFFLEDPCRFEMHLFMKEFRMCKSTYYGSVQTHSGRIVLERCRWVDVHHYWRSIMDSYGIPIHKSCRMVRNSL